SLIKVTRILFQQRWQDCVSDEDTSDGRGVLRSETFPISLCSLAVSRDNVVPLLGSGNETNAHESDGIHSLLPGKLKLLPCVQMSCIGHVADVEIRNESQYPLFFLLFDLSFRHLGAVD